MFSGPQLFNILTNRPPGRPRWPFRINRSSPQAMGLRSWHPLIHGQPTQLVRGGPAIEYGAGGSFGRVFQPETSGLSHDKPTGTPEPNIGDFGPGNTGFEAVTITIWQTRTASANSSAKIVSKEHGGDFDVLYSKTPNVWTIYLNGSQVDSANQGADIPENGTPRFIGMQVGGSVRRLFSDSPIRDLSGDGTWAIDTTGDAVINSNTNALTVMNNISVSRAAIGTFWDFRVYDRILDKAIVESMYCRYTRYDLYEEYGQRTYLFPTMIMEAAAAEAAVGNPYYAYAQQ